MTAVAGIQCEGHVVIAADRRSMRGWDISTTPQPKIWVWEGKSIVMGLAGLALHCDHIYRNLVIPDFVEGESTDEYVMGRLSVAVRDVFFNSRDFVKDAIESRKEPHDIGVGGLVVVRGSLYLIDSQGSLEPITRPYLAAGSGDEYASGAMYALGVSGLLISDPVHSVRTAIAAACEHSATCAPPIDIYCAGYDFVEKVENYQYSVVSKKEITEVGIEDIVYVSTDLNSFQNGNS